MRYWYLCGKKARSVFYIDIFSVKKIDCMYQTNLFINDIYDLNG